MLNPIAAEWQKSIFDRKTTRLQIIQVVGAESNLLQATSQKKRRQTALP